MRTASAAAQTPVDCSELHQQPVDAVLRPTFVQKLCYELPSVVTLLLLTLLLHSCRLLIKILCSLLSGIKIAAFA